MAIKYYHNYPDYVISAVKHWYFHNDEPVSTRDVQKMEPSDVLSKFLEWEGIIGYDRFIEGIFTCTIWEEEIK